MNSYQRDQWNAAVSIIADAHHAVTEIMLEMPHESAGKAKCRAFLERLNTFDSGAFGPVTPKERVPDYRGAAGDNPAGATKACQQKSEIDP